ncbi:MAG: carbohydrate ABC transporter permease [Candidatus Hodarchaeales archaeon]
MKTSNRGFKAKIIELMGGKEDAGFISVMLTPAGFIFVIGILFPLVYGIFISMFYLTRTNPDANLETFIHIRNYLGLLSDQKFIKYYINTIIFTVVTVTFELFLGLIIALLLNRKFRFRGIVRAAILVPWAIPTIVNARIWEYMFKADMQGLANDILWRLGVIEKSDPIIFYMGDTILPLNLIWIFAFFAFPISLIILTYAWCSKLLRKEFNFLENKSEVAVAIILLISTLLLVMPSNLFGYSGALGLFTVPFPTDFFVVFIVDIWKTTPFMALLILAGLQVIPQDLYKAVEVDGASQWQAFRHVTLPLLLPGIGTALIFRTIDAFRVYDILTVFAGEAIKSITVYAVDKHRFGFYGTASAIAIVEFLNIIVFTVLFMYLTRRRGEL